MLIAGWGKNYQLLAIVGERPCTNCHHTTRHFLLGERKEVKVYFVPVARFGRKKYLFCEVFKFKTLASEEEASRIMTSAVQASVGEPGGAALSAPGTPPRPDA
jgi:hypothetical protein